jgi:hypothetical protein
LASRFQDRHSPLRAEFFWLYHGPGFSIKTASFVITAGVLGFLLLPHLASRTLVG